MRLGFLSFALLLPLFSQRPLTPETLLLARIKYHNLLTLQKLPNYTCRETIERSFRNPPDRKFRLHDLVRLEVAFVGNRELYGWPGATKFEETDITEMVKGGAIGNGIFGMHTKSILSGQANFTHKGLEEWRGRRAEL